MKIAWTRLALHDLENAYTFVAENSPKAAIRVMNRLEETLSHLKAYPNTGRKGRVENTRELVILNTPFILIYRIQEKRIEILAFLHGRRKWP